MLSSSTLVEPSSAVMPLCAIASRSRSNGLTMICERSASVRCRYRGRFMIARMICPMLVWIFERSAEICAIISGEIAGGAASGDADAAAPGVCLSSVTPSFSLLRFASPAFAIDLPWCCHVATERAAITTRLQIPNVRNIAELMCGFLPCDPAVPPPRRDYAKVLIRRSTQCYQE